MYKNIRSRYKMSDVKRVLKLAFLELGYTSNEADKRVNSLITKLAADKAKAKPKKGLNVDSLIEKVQKNLAKNLESLKEMPKKETPKKEKK
jgi:hypothetical protein